MATITEDPSVTWVRHAVESVLRENCSQRMHSTVTSRALFGDLYPPRTQLLAIIDTYHANLTGDNDQRAATLVQHLTTIFPDPNVNNRRMVGSGDMEETTLIYRHIIHLFNMPTATGFYLMVSKLAHTLQLMRVWLTDPDTYTFITIRDEAVALLRICELTGLNIPALHTNPPQHA